MHGGGRTTTHVRQPSAGVSDRAVRLGADCLAERHGTRRIDVSAASRKSGARRNLGASRRAAAEIEPMRTGLAVLCSCERERSSRAPTAPRLTGHMGLPNVPHPGSNTTSLPSKAAVSAEVLRRPRRQPREPPQCTLVLGRYQRL
jgi:hypothetical protein